MRLSDLDPADRRTLDRILAGKFGNRRPPDPRGLYRPELHVAERAAAMKAAIEDAENDSR